MIVDNIVNPKRKQIEVVPYNPNWPKMFEAEAALMSEVLDEHCLAIHHIGSTSVPGLAAKPYLDMMCVVDELSSALELQKVGYVFKGEYNIPLRYGFTKKTSSSKVNLHVVENDHGFIPLNLCFRDYLRAHEEARRSYANLKEELLKDPKSHEKMANRFSGYNLGKDRFIKGILDKAGFDSLTINFCLHHQEWEAYHRIRQEQIFERTNVIYDRNHPTLSADQHYHFVLYKGTHIVCVAHVEFLNEYEAALRSLATDEAYKRQGYGTHMMTMIEKWVKQQGRQILKFHANLNAEHFYRELGYIDMPFNDPSIPKDIIDLGKML